MLTRPVWAEISLNRLTRNYDLLRRAVVCEPGQAAPELLAVVKADAYGHGVELCGPALAARGARWLGVTSVEEGVRLRRVLGVLPGPLGNARILVMSGFWPGEAELLLDRGLTPQVWEGYHFALLEEAARGRGLSAGSVPVHLEIDTGMARQGVAAGAGLGAVLQEYFRPGSPLRIEGVMTHFSAPEMLDGPDTGVQMARFGEALEQLGAAGIRPQWIHAGNSATVFDGGHTAALVHLAARYGAQSMLRPGLGLYGYPVRFTHCAPRIAEDTSQRQLQPVLAWKTRITSLRNLLPGDGAGYNSTFRAARPTRVALTPVGYADGLHRMLSNRGAMLVRGLRAPIAGRISMDQTILDVTAIRGVAIGDEVVILGEQVSEHGTETIGAWEHAELCGTIPYEILCNISARVPRCVVDEPNPV